MSTAFTASASVDGDQITVTRPQQAPDPVEAAVDDMIYRLRESGGQITRIDLAITVDDSSTQPPAQGLPPETQTIAQGEPAPPDTAPPVDTGDPTLTPASAPTIEGAASSEQPAADAPAG
jgi:hypothetical protein